MWWRICVLKLIKIWRIVQNVTIQLFTLSLLLFKIKFTWITNNHNIDLCRCTNINGFWLISDASWNIQYLIFTSAKLCTILFNISPFSLLSITCLYMAPTNQILILEIKDKIFYIPRLYARQTYNFTRIWISLCTLS